MAAPFAERERCDRKEGCCAVGAVLALSCPPILAGFNRAPEQLGPRDKKIDGFFYGTPRSRCKCQNCTTLHRFAVRVQ